MDRNNVVIAGDREQEFQRLDASELESTPERFIQVVEQKETGLADCEYHPCSGAIQRNDYCEELDSGNLSDYAGRAGAVALFLLFYSNPSHPAG